MRVLSKLKLFVAAAVVAVGMSSCLKGSDPTFQIFPSVAYIQQSGSGESVNFQPAMQLQGNMPIKAGMMTPVCKFMNQNYYFETVEGYSNYLLEMTSSMNMPVAGDTIDNWAFSVEATSDSEQPAQASIQLSFPEKKPLGKFNVESMEYSADKGTITGVWNKVENAADYLLVFKKSPSNMWLASDEFTVIENDGKLTATVSINLEKGTPIKIGVAASNGTFWQILGTQSITGGTDAKW